MPANWDAERSARRRRRQRQKERQRQRQRLLQTSASARSGALVPPLPPPSHWRRLSLGALARSLAGTRRRPELRTQPASERARDSCSHHCKRSERIRPPAGWLARSAWSAWQPKVRRPLGRRSRPSAYKDAAPTMAPLVGRLGRHDEFGRLCCRCCRLCFYCFCDDDNQRALGDTLAANVCPPIKAACSAAE